MHPVAQAPSEQGAIVSSAHLVSKHSAEMSGFELGLTVADNAFHHWVVHCTAPAAARALGQVRPGCVRSSPAVVLYPCSGSNHLPALVP